MLARDDCPVPADLQGLLDGALPDDLEEHLSEHLGGCERCQRRLESLAAGIGRDVRAYLRARPADTLPADLHGTPEYRKLIAALSPKEQSEGKAEDA